MIYYPNTTTKFEEKKKWPINIKKKKNKKNITCWYQISQKQIRLVIIILNFFWRIRLKNKFWYLHDVCWQWVVLVYIIHCKYSISLIPGCHSLTILFTPQVSFRECLSCVILFVSVLIISSSVNLCVNLRALYFSSQTVTVSISQRMNLVSALSCVI